MEREIGIIYYDNQQTLDFKTDYGYLDPRYISSELLLYFSRRSS
jgi:hypothetical protein